jgi:hypothetical protein
VARPDLGTDTDTLANLKLGDLGVDLDDLADDLVAGDDEFGGEGSPASGDGVVVLHAHGRHVHRAKRGGEGARRPEEVRVFRIVSGRRFNEHSGEVWHVCCDGIKVRMTITRRKAR